MMMPWGAVWDDVMMMSWGAVWDDVMMMSWGTVWDDVMMMSLCWISGEDSAGGKEDTGR